MRIVAVAVVAAVSLTCADQTVSGVRRMGLAQLAISPVFDQAPSGGPNIDIAKVRGTLKKLSGTDSVVAEGLVAGDSAILEFSNVAVTGDSTAYNLGIQAFDQSGIQVFTGHQELKVKPGENKPAAPLLSYSAPDMTVASISVSPKPLALDWAGAAPNDVSCLNRAPSPTAKTQQLLTIAGKNATNVDVAAVRVGWTSRDTSVASVDASGLVKARCSNKSTYVVARTFLNVVDSVQVSVTAPPFTLLMSPDSTSLARADSVKLTALVVDENNNQLPASQVTWTSSDLTRATVNSAGLVKGIRNGRVVITASSGNRTTIGIVQVVRPKAASVVVLPGTDTFSAGQVGQFFAKALDAFNRVIGDATGFQWSSSATSVATIAGNGVATAQANGSTSIVATIDGKSGSATLTVGTVAPGSIRSKVVNGQTDGPIAGAQITDSSSGGSAQSASDGTFTLGGVRAGDNLTMTANNFVSVTLFNAPAFPNLTLQIPNVPLSPVSTSTGTMLGKTQNALTGAGISGITVRAYAGLNAGPSPQRPSPPVVATATSGSDGLYSFSGVNPGAYTFVASGTGYSDGIGVGISIGGGSKATPPLILAPAAASAGLYVVLTWGDCTQVNVPCDLDLHATGPKSTTDATRFHVYRGNRAYVLDPDTIAALDIDATNGRGPEVIGLRPSAAPGTYRFYVHNFTNSSVSTSRQLADSASARVDVYQDGHAVGTFFPPPGQQGTLWEVFDYDGARMTPVGVITQPADPTVLPIRAAPVDPSSGDRRRVFISAQRPKTRQ